MCNRVRNLRIGKYAPVQTANFTLPPAVQTSSANGPHLNIRGFDISAAEFPQRKKTSLVCI